MPWMAALVFSLKTPHSQKSQGYMFEEQEGQMFFSTNIGIFSCKFLNLNSTRLLALFWTREDLDEHHLVCIVIARNPRHHDLFWIIKSSTVLVFRPAGIKCDDTTQPSLATQPITITEAGFFNCVIECIAGGDSCVLTVGDFIRNQPVANMMSGGQTSLRLSWATTSQRVDSIMGCYEPYNLLVFNSDI